MTIDRCQWSSDRDGAASLRRSSLLRMRVGNWIACIGLYCRSDFRAPLKIGAVLAVAHHCHFDQREKSFRGREKRIFLSRKRFLPLVEMTTCKVLTNF